MILDFDPELARLAVIADTGKVVTREGYPVEITCWDTERITDAWPVRGKIHFPLDDLSSVESWTRKGRYSYREGGHKYDLFIETNLDL